MNRPKRIAVIPGDGIGPEVIAQGVSLLNAISDLECVHFDWGADKWLRDGVGLPAGALDDLVTNYDAILFGALGDPRIPDMAHGREILLGMRQGLDLYVNLRPIKNNDQIDMVVVRENTEDAYVSMGGNFKKGTKDEVSIDESIHTYKGVERIIRYAFELARTQKRKKVTLGDKSNAVRFGGALWQRVFREVSAGYGDIQAEHLFVDVMAMEMVRKPERFDVIVTTNLFGDILTDLGAALTGGLGLAASANIHPGKIALFEPVHGSAPDIASKKSANPMATFLTIGMMLDYLQLDGVSQMIENAVSNAIREHVVTPDLGGKCQTDEVARYVIDEVRSRCCVV